jgi:hypothetical protein
MAPPRIPTKPDSSGFVFSPIMRTRRLGGRGAATPRIGLKAGFAGERGDGSVLVDRSQPELRLAKLCRVTL